MPKDNGHLVTVDNDVHSIVSRYAAINSITFNEALRRIVLNDVHEDEGPKEPEYIVDAGESF